jgi:ABC-type Fe3+ transport system permease subunit
VRASLEVGKYSDHLRLTTSPESSQHARELFVTLRNWAVTHQPPLWQRLWGHLYGVHWFIWLSILVGVMPFLPSASEGVEHLVRSQAQELLRDGLSQEEVLRAVELLLISTAKWAPNVKPIALPAWYKVVLFGGLAASVMLSIRPKVIVGVGRGRQVLDRWRWWMKFVGVTIPGLLFGSFIWPWLSERITEWLK